jgi:hypothetical protein
VAGTRYNRLMKRLLPLLAVPALLLAGCSGGNDKTATPPAAVNTAPTKTAAIPGTGPSSGPAPRCQTKDLSVKLANGDTSAGTIHTDLIFTDRSGHRCTISGFPTVSWVTGSKNTQVNIAFRHSGTAKKKVVLIPGEQARAILVTHAVSGIPASRCKPVSVRAYRVYPPGETTALLVDTTEKQCSTKGINAGQVLAIGEVPGASE